jgi:hypothetical protein
VSESQVVPIDLIVNDRERSPEDDLLPLIKSIKKVGLKMPILLDNKMQLIDGLRRLRVLQLQGVTDVPVVISSDLDTSCKVITETREHGVAAQTITPRRTWEVFSALTEQQRERGHLMRKRRVGVPRGQSLIPVMRSRALIQEALGIAKESYLAVSVLLYKTAHENTNEHLAATYATILEKLERGELTLYEARGEFSKVNEGKIVDPHELATGSDAQRDALGTALSQLRGTIHGLARIGEIHPKLQQAELQLWLRGFEDNRRDLQRFINSLRKVVSER